MTDVLFFCPAYTRFRGGIEYMVSVLVNHLDSEGLSTAVLTIGNEIDHPNPVFSTPDSTRIIQTTIEDTRASRTQLKSLVSSLNPKVFIARGASHVLLNLVESCFDLDTRLILSESFDPANATKNYPDPESRLQAFAAADRIHLLINSFRSSFPESFQNRIVAIANPTQTNPNLAQPEGQADRSKWIVHVGRIVLHQKAQDVLVQAFAKLAPAYPEWNLKLIGDDYRPEDKEKLQSLIRKLKVMDRVEIIGSLEHHHVLEVLTQCHIFAFPSYFEGFGIALAEALATGLPAVGFAEAPAVNELIRHDWNGLLAAGLGDPNTLSAALKQMMDDPAARVRWGKNAQEGAQAYAIPRIAQTWEQLIRDLIKVPKAFRHSPDGATSEWIQALKARFEQPTLGRGRLAGRSPFSLIKARLAALFPESSMIGSRMRRVWRLVRRAKSALLGPRG